MSTPLSEQEQLEIIKEVEEKYSKFLDPNFDASVFLECRDNFALTSHIESVKIFEMENAPINPTFTIAIPTYDRCETLKEAIDSALNQGTNEQYEIIVVENVDDFDLKTPAQEMLEKEYLGKITYYKNKQNIEMFGNWNRCISLAKGKWICVLHSDDVITTNYLTEMKQALTLVTQTTILIGCLDQNREQKHCIFDDCSYHRAMADCPPNAILHNKEQTIRLGGYNPDEYPIADTFFFCRVVKYGKVLVLQKRLQQKRDEISEYFKPQTLILYCFLGGSYILGLYKPRWYAKYQAYLYIRAYQSLIKDNNLLYNFIEKKLTELKLTPPNRFIQLMIKLWEKIFYKRGG